MKTIFYTDNNLKKVINGTKTRTSRIIKPQPILMKPEFKGQELYFQNPKFIKNGNKEYHHPVLTQNEFINEFARYQLMCLKVINS